MDNEQQGTATAWYEEFATYLADNEDWPADFEAPVADLRALTRATPLEYCRQRLENVGLQMGRVLELGCGTGRWSFSLAPHCEYVLGVDLNVPRLTFATHLANHFGLDHVDFRESSVTKLDEPDGSFDSIVCYSVTVGNNILDGTLQESFRLLRPGGMLYVSLNGMGWNYMLRDVSSKVADHYEAMGREGVYNTVVNNGFGELLAGGSAHAAVLAKNKRFSGEANQVAALNQVLTTLDAAATYEEAVAFLEAQAGPSFIDLLHEDLTGILTGKTNTFSLGHTPNGYQPDAVQVLCEKIGFEGFQWASEGLLHISPESVELVPVYAQTHLDDELVVWDFVVTKPGGSPSTTSAASTTAAVAPASTPPQTGKVVAKTAAPPVAAPTPHQRVKGDSIRIDQGARAQRADVENASARVPQPHATDAPKKRRFFGRNSASVDVSVRAYPKPFHAALAINNDTDGTRIDTFNDWHDFVNGTDETSYGTGLNLEVGDAFWIWSAHGNLALCHNEPTAGTELTEYAPRLQAMAQAGYLDSLHTFGNWTTDWRMDRDHANRGLDLLTELDMHPTVWSDHGGGEHFTHCIGSRWWHYEQGDNPDHRSYCTDLLNDFGFEFFWGSRMFELERFGEHRQFADQAAFDADYNSYDCPQLYSAAKYDADGNRLEGSRDAIAASDRPHWKRRFFNRILIEDELRDGTKMYWFKRYRGLDGPTAANLVEQISYRNLDLLEKNNAAVVVYQHMGVWRGVTMPMGHPSGGESVVPVIDRSCQVALTELAERERQGRIWVATSSRLLSFLRMRDSLVFDVDVDHATAVIHIRRIDCWARGSYVPDPKELMGLCFELSGDISDARVMDSNGDQLNEFKVSKTESGLDVSYPWQKLDYVHSRDT